MEASTSDDIGITWAPNPFVGCPDYQGEKDDKYVACLSNTTGDPCDLIHELHVAKDFRSVLGVLPFILSLLTIILNSIFVYLIYLHIFRKGRASRKRYTFLINRSGAAIIAQCLIYIVLITWKTHQFKYSSVTLFLIAGGLSFLVYTLTYLLITWLLYKAVTDPFWYKKAVTIQRCLFIIGCIWLLSIVFSIILGLYAGTIFYAESAPIHCPYDSCQFPLSVSVVVILTVCYALVIIFYLIMVFRMHWKNRNSLINDTDSNGRTRERSTTTSRNIRTMNRLSLSLVAFSVSKLPLIVVAFVALYNLSHLSELGKGQKLPCKTFAMSRLFYKVEILATVAACLWLLGMCIDPVISIFSDPPLIADLRKRFKRFIQFMSNLFNRNKEKPKLSHAQTLSNEDTSSGVF
ncbi:7 transmembrane receptor [Aphelenchoides bicaudatus]|nr:7 transmembrane receptor [Aphelenchoides bicaudatus]